MPAPTAPALYWPDEFTLSTFQMLLDTLTGTIDFAVAAVSVVRDGWLQAVGAVEGGEGTSWKVKADVPAADIATLRSWGESWGTFTYVPHERVARGRTELDWVTDADDETTSLDPGAWGPLSLLFAPFYGDGGDLVGILWVDLPVSGRLPSAEERAALDRFATIIGKAVLASSRRGAIIRRLELAEATRAMVRAASLELDPETIFGRISDALVSSFGLANAWARIFATADAGEAVWIAGEASFQLPAMDSRHGDPVGTSQELWRRQTVGVLYADGDQPGLPVGPTRDIFVDWLQRSGLSSFALVPLGWGDTCIGALSLARPAGAPRWDTAEIEAATEVGRDLGQVIRLSQTFAREQASVRRLQELDAYRSRFVAMVSHELKNPLTAVLANLELLGDVTAEDATAARAVAGANRAAQRMDRLVGDLLLLARATDAEQPRGADVIDLAEVVRDVCDLTEVSAAQREITVHIRISPQGPMTVAGDAGQLDRVVINLVSNALKYTPEGRSITIGMRRVADEVELDVSDEGIGISEPDQARIREEFFRSNDPQVSAQAGTGLGLAIAEQVVRRHGGRLEVHSELGRGSTFRVRLPAAEPRT